MAMNVPDSNNFGMDIWSRLKNNSLSPEMRMGLLQAGLGILANNTGHYGQAGPAIGKGGLLGAEGYNNAVKLKMLKQQQEEDRKYREETLGIRQGELDLKTADAARAAERQDFLRNYLTGGSTTSSAIPQQAAPDAPQQFSPQIGMKAQGGLGLTVPNTGIGWSNVTPGATPEERQLIEEYEKIRSSGGYPPPEMEAKRSEIAMRGHNQDFGPQSHFEFLPESQQGMQMPPSAPQQAQSPAQQGLIQGAKQSVRGSGFDPDEMMRMGAVMGGEEGTKLQNYARYLKEAQNTQTTQDRQSRIDARDNFVIDEDGVGKNKTTDQQFYMENGVWKPFKNSADVQEYKNKSRRAAATKLSIKTFDQNLDLYDRYTKAADPFVTGKNIADAVLTSISQGEAGNTLGWKAATKQFQALLETFEKSNTAALAEVARIEQTGDLLTRVSGWVSRYVSGEPSKEQQKDLKELTKVLKALNNSKLVEVNEQFESMAELAELDPNMIIGKRNRPKKQEALDLQGKSDAEILNELLGID